MEEKKEKKNKTLRRVLVGAGIIGFCVEASRDFKEVKMAGDFFINTGNKIASGVKGIFSSKECRCEEPQQEERTFSKNQNWRRDK
jgi:hypothetical protein